MLGGFAIAPELDFHLGEVRRNRVVRRELEGGQKRAPRRLEVSLRVVQDALVHQLGRLFGGPGPGGRCFGENQSEQQGANQGLHESTYCHPSTLLAKPFRPEPRSSCVKKWASGVPC